MYVKKDFTVATDITEQASAKTSSIRQRKIAPRHFDEYWRRRR